MMQINKKRVLNKAIMVIEVKNPGITLIREALIVEEANLRVVATSLVFKVEIIGLTMKKRVFNKKSRLINLK